MKQIEQIANVYPISTNVSSALLAPPSNMKYFRLHSRYTARVMITKNYIDALYMKLNVKSETWRMQIHN